MAASLWKQMTSGEQSLRCSATGVLLPAQASPAHCCLPHQLYTPHQQFYNTKAERNEAAARQRLTELLDVLVKGLTGANDKGGGPETPPAGTDPSVYPAALELWHWSKQEALHDMMASLGAVQVLCLAIRSHASGETAGLSSALTPVVSILCSLCFNERCVAVWFNVSNRVSVVPAFASHIANTPPRIYTQECDAN